MKRNVSLIAAALFCFASFAMATEQKGQSAPQPQQTEQQMNVARNDANAHMHGDASSMSECPPDHRKHSNSKQMQGDPEGDPQASQNQVEYGGGG